jgi:hypothetical protein
MVKAQTEPLQGEPRHEVEQAHAEDARGNILMKDWITSRP